MATRKSVVDFEIRGANGLNTIKQLEDRVKVLRREWRNAADEATRALKMDELKASNVELQRHTTMVKGMNGAWSDFKKNFLSIASGVLGGNLITVAAQFLIGIIPGLISKAGKLSDSLADVRKTTGMTRTEVEALNSDLKKMDTRTSREELRKLAMEAGKLGKESTQDVLDFVSAADKITVALGEDLGADAVTKIGKITQTFDLEKMYGMENAMLKVGSAVNSIGQASSANEKNIVEFTYRTQGLASAAGIAVGDILGYAATLDMAGQSMEVGATVTNKLFVALGTDVPKFAKLAKMGVQDFAKLLQTDANEALIRVLENVKGNNKGLLGMAEILKKLGLEGQESVNVVSALANNTETLRKQQELGNEEFRKGTSILDEFNIKNNTTAGILEKISHWWSSLTAVGSGGWVDWMITKFGKLVGVVNELDLSTQETAENIQELDAKNKDLATNEKKLIPLVNRYDELKKKTKLNNDEQNELKTVVMGIASIMPSAVTELDKYGNALSVNTQKAREFIKIQKDYLKVENASKIDATQEELISLKQKLEAAKKERMNPEIVEETGSIWLIEKKTKADYDKDNVRIAKLNRDIEMKSNYLKKLNGDFMDVVNSETTTPPVVTPPIKLGDGNLGGLADKRKTEADKEIEEQKRLKDELRKIRNKMEVEQLQDKEKELKQNELHYAELRLKAKTNAENLIEIDAQEKAEKGLIEAKYEAKLNEALAKVYEDKRRESMNDAEREIVLTMDKYEKLLELAGDNEAKIKEIVALEAEEIDAIRKKYAKGGSDVIEQS
ncbi:phage tail tape measure protein, partial [Emticicia sp.]|uniref:phage tail tape measure protein n=1 Tax=Emticicia sp. TaxID=1930953 RepID=UPI0037524B8C